MKTPQKSSWGGVGGAGKGANTNHHSIRCRRCCCHWLRPRRPRRSRGSTAAAPVREKVTSCARKGRGGWRRAPPTPRTREPLGATCLGPAPQSRGPPRRAGARGPESAREQEEGALHGQVRARRPRAAARGRQSARAARILPAGPELRAPGAAPGGSRRRRRCPSKASSSLPRARACGAAACRAPRGVGVQGASPAGATRPSVSLSGSV